MKKIEIELQQERIAVVGEPVFKLVVIEGAYTDVFGREQLVKVEDGEVYALSAQHDYGNRWYDWNAFVDGHPIFEKLWLSAEKKAEIIKIWNA